MDNIYKNRRINKTQPITRGIKHWGLSGYSSIQPRIKFGVTGQESSPQSPTISYRHPLFATVSFAQSTSEAPTQNILPDSNAVYRLFVTRNKFTFIKLNTRNGQMSHIQWGTGTNDHFEYLLSNTSLVSKEDEKNGRFFLYPTTNIYNFILLDQIDGRTWQVQWSTEEKNRMVLRIY